MHRISAVTIRVRLLDWGALALLVFEIPSLSFSLDRANGIDASEIMALSVLAYFAMRLLVRAPQIAGCIAALVGIGGASLAASGIDQFVTGAQQLAAVGLTDLVAFRSRFIHPIRDWVSGECFTAILLTLSFACAAGVYAWRIKGGKLAVLTLLPAFPIVVLLLLSLSRAVFWSTILFFAAACVLMAVYRVVELRTASFLLVGSFGMLLLILACETQLYPGIIRAYAGGNISQVRSTEGRIGIWTRSLELVRGHRLWGVGSSNAALFLLSSASQEETTGFASRAFSLPVQILTEKGLIGFACYAAFFLLLSWEFHRGMRLGIQAPTGTIAAAADGKLKKNRRDDRGERAGLRAENAHRAMKCCFAAGLAAVLFRELTYSSLLEHTLTLALALALAALMCATSEPEDLRIKSVAIVVAAVVLILQWPYSRYAEADAKLSEFYGQVASANFIAARESIENAIHLWPWNARYYGWRAYVTSQELPSQSPMAPGSDMIGLSDRDRNAARLAADDYRHALSLNGRDAVAHHNLAWLEHLLGDDAAAARDWKVSVEIDPDNSAFHLSYGMFLKDIRAFDEARSQFESAIQMEPSTLDSQFFARYRSRSPEAAASLVKEAIGTLQAQLTRNNDPILEARLGKLYLFAGDSSQAQRLLIDASRQLPNLPLVWLNLGEIYEARGDQEEARTCYNRAHVIDASLAETYLRLGELNLRTGDKEGAIRDFNVAVQRWQRVNPITSAHNNRLFDGPRQTIDDLLPTTLVWYITPCQASEAWAELAVVYPQDTEYARRSRTCEDIPAPHRELQ